MSTLRLLTSATRRASTTLALGRRGYAEVNDKLKLSLVLPHEVWSSYNCYCSVTNDGNSHCTRRRTFYKSISRRKQVTWVFWRTMSPRLKLSVLVWWKLLRGVVPQKSSSVRGPFLSFSLRQTHTKLRSFWRICHSPSK